MTKKERVEEANKVLMACASYGRRFFSTVCDRRTTDPNPTCRVSRFDLDANGRLWYIDKWRNDRVYTGKGSDGFSRGFSEGGSLRDLCQALAAYIRTGKPIPSLYFGPWPEWYCRGDLWGYGDDMEKVRQVVFATKAVAQTESVSK